jgi:hypothetical protein
MHVTGEPHGRRGHGGGARCTYSNAMHPEHTGAMGAGRTDRHAGEYADARQHVSVDVYLGRRHHVCDARRIHRRSSVDKTPES